MRRVSALQSKLQQTTTQDHMWMEGIELCVTDMRVSAIKSRLINNKQFLSDHDAMLSVITFKTIEVNESYREHRDNMRGWNNPVISVLSPAIIVDAFQSEQ